MNNDNKVNRPGNEELETFDYFDQFDQQTFIKFLKKFVTDIEQGKFKIVPKDPEEQSLEVKVPKEILAQVDYEKSEMLVDASKSKYLFVIALAWSDLGIEVLQNEESDLEADEEGYDEEFEDEEENEDDEEFEDEEENEDDEDEEENEADEGEEDDENHNDEDE